MKIKRMKHGYGFKLLICVGIYAALLVTVSFVMALIAFGGEDPGGVVGTYALVSLLVAAALGGVVSSRIIGEGGAPRATAAALLFTLFLLAIGMIASGGGLSPGSFMNSGCYLAIAALFAFLGRKKAGRRRKR